MPPSGYSDREVRCLRDFLQSCSQALERESAAARRPLDAGLKREIEHIRSVRDESPAFARAALELTETFYRQVLDALERTGDYAAAVRETLKELDEQVSSIHVPS